MTLKASELDRAWQKLGMIIKNAGDRYARFYEGGRLIITTRRSHGAAKLDGQIPYLIRQQMKLNEAQFDSLIACPLKRPEYIEILRKKGWL